MSAKSSKRGARRAAEKSNVIPIAPSDEFLIVAIGASAGGIEATSELVRKLPLDTGMAFIVVQHLDPKHHSILSELLAKETAMQVSEVTDRMKIEPNHIYVIPPDATMSISDSVLRLTPREESRARRMPIDYFMRSLAEAHSNNAIGVVLSGTGSDGTLGLAEIHAQGGVTLVQDETTARYDGMPRSAIASGCVDFILSPEGIARELTRIAKHPYAAVDRTKDASVAGLPVDGIESIFQVLRRATGVDFTHYRQSTIRRRIHRRMIVHKIDRLADYVKYVLTNPPEVKALYQDMLINVTSFLRNPKVFEALKTEVFPNIVKHCQPNSTIRLWTPACSSGEETYSLAIALLEFLGDRVQEIPVQIFGTDISEPSINEARTAWYPENILGDVSPERLRRFFNKADGGYRISKAIRDMCIFAQHNVLGDPPFSQMDLICCRNLLIYLEPILQNRVISLFHYAIRNHGYLVLGSSESVGASGNLFATEDSTHRIFSKKATVARQPVTFSMGRQMERAEFGPAQAGPKVANTNWNYLEAQKEFDRRLLAQYCPAAVFVNEDMDIIHTRGNVGHYLKLAPGRASLNILKMAREGLLLDLRNALTRAKKDRTNVRKQAIELKNGNGNDHAIGAKDIISLVNIEVVPITTGGMPEPYYMIIFSEAAPAAPKSVRSQKAIRESESASRRIAKLEQELAATKEYLQSMIETQEATNEELQSANEEVLSSNEELQSTNEELETAKEELQSANEELATVNDELRTRNTYLTRGHKDLSNLFTGIGMAILIVGGDMEIQRFTPQARKIFGFIPDDVGRPLKNINPNIDIPNLREMITKVIASSQEINSEVSDQRGMRYALRLFPYAHAEGHVTGVVLTLTPASVVPKS